MSLYNMVHGYHPLAADLLMMLDFDTPEERATIPRFRDIYLFQDEIRLLTRTGGGNRDSYVEENEALTQRKGYLWNWDDGFDSTFAWWAYEWPEDQKEQLQEIYDVLKKKRPDLLPDDLKELFDTAVKRMEKSTKRK